jgi:hypothetical protein
MSDDFKERLINHAKLALSRAERATSEEAAKQYLILPFFNLLGYDPLDPDEIIPEAHASFSDKFKNRVDYAICINGEPVIAVECKKTGSIVEANRGELKGYFNAVPSTKLGILTDGLIFELYSDTKLENMMDDEPFARVDLSAVAKERINEQAFDALVKLRKGTFDPADVGADAKRKIFTARYVEVLERSFSNPHEDFIRVIMDLAGIEGRKTAKLVEENSPIVSEALQIFLDKKILERVGFANRQDIVRMQQATAPAQAAPAEPPPAPADQGRDIQAESGIITTDTELKIYNHVKNRLSFLVEDEAHFERVQQLFYKDYKTIFSVCYKQERRGKLFNFREGPNGEYRFEFPENSETVEVTNLYELDQPLLTSFLNRVQELG